MLQASQGALREVEQEERQDGREVEAAERRDDPPEEVQVDIRHSEDGLQRPDALRLREPREQDAERDDLSSGLPVFFAPRYR